MARPAPNNLKEVYECLVECVLQGRSIEDILPHLSPDILFYGTAEHEKVFNIKELREFLLKQNKEAAQFTIHFVRSGLLFEKSFADGRGRILVEEFRITIEEVDHTLQMRLSLTFDNVNDSWICLHVHASTPDSNIDQTESFPVEGLRKRNKELEDLVAAKTEELRLSLENLRSTQSQLIQSEKMAALGELTAGIAHEIQNPLNFVNNFSEVNTELIDELKVELARLTDGQAVGNRQSADEIANDIKSNSEKINHHGKRAGDIVKGMLQHSRSSSGVKEPTDINALVDEYLRLAYHGLRAKDKTFNATMNTEYDQTIGNINIIPQDIGRVILNLINNAFYAVNEKAHQNTAGYEPTVSVSTKKEVNRVLIFVKDNGNGIPQKILDKIFQPFFTTKPTGQGTGLGLSLSYDIVKAHGGELSVRTPSEKVETLSADLSDPNVVKAEAAAQAGKEGVGSEFVVSLPIV